MISTALIIAYTLKLISAESLDSASLARALFSAPLVEIGKYFLHKPELSKVLSGVL